MKKIEPSARLMWTVGAMGLVVLVGILLFGRQAQPAPVIKPNIILISIDTLRPDHLGAFGYGGNTSPAIDSFAVGGSYASDISAVVPVTAPSFASLFTGRHPFTKKFESVSKYMIMIDDKTPTLASVLKNNGYVTAAYVTNRTLWKDLTNIHKGFDEYHETDVFREAEYEAFIQEALAWLRKKRTTPFFYWIHLMEPHAPYDPPEKFRCSFSPSLCPAVSKTHQDELEENRENLQGCRAKPVSEKTLSLYESLYDGEIRAVDDRVRSIMEEIAASSLNNNSIVVLYSDHGEGLDHNYYFEHGETLYESSQKILFALQHPTFTPVGRVAVPMQSTDIAPTLLDLAGIPRNNFRFDGSSMADFFRGDPLSLLRRLKARRRYLYGTNENESKFSIYDGTHKYIYSLNGSCPYNGKNEELYVISTDPNELHDVSVEKSKLRDGLRNALLSTLASFGYGFESANTRLPGSGFTTEQKDAFERLKSLGY